jgi:mono/diheme cytochrome c family protein
VRLGWLFAGALLALAAMTAGEIRFLAGSSREAPAPMVRSVARLARSAATPGPVKDTPNPVADSPEVQSEARAHWADHCASCHANNGSGDTPMGRNLYPPAPDMRQPDTQAKTDGELFYIIENGLRLSGMPAWGGHSDPSDSWKLVRFIRRLPQLNAQELQEMEKLNPKSPDELKEEQEEKEFLNGGTSHEHPVHEHH